MFRMIKKTLKDKNMKSTMKGLVYGGPGKIELKNIPKPGIEKPTDALVKIIKTTICGTDLGILHGKTPSCKPGTTLGHEGVGVIEEVGTGVRSFKKGDHVIISCITSDGTCEYCKKQMYSHCEDGGWILGHLINGTQAEYVRIPHADNSLHHIPKGADEESLVMLSDILPTGHEIGVLNGNVKPGDTIVIVGAGPIGMSVLLTSQFYSPAKIYMIDVDENGVDVAIEAVGVPPTFDMCQDVIRPGGHVAVVGVHGKSVDFKLQDLWIKNITLRTGLVNTNTTPMLLKTVVSEKIDPKKLITHHFKLANIMKAYEVFGNAGKEKAMKVIIEP